MVQEVPNTDPIADAARAVADTIAITNAISYSDADDIADALTAFGYTIAIAARDGDSDVIADAFRRAFPDTKSHDHRDTDFIRRAHALSDDAAALRRDAHAQHADEASGDGDDE